MTTKKFIIISIGLFLLVLPAVLYFTSARKPNIANLGSGALPKDPESIKRLQAILPINSKNFSIGWNDEKGKIQIELFEPKNESLNALNSWFIENGFAQIPWQLIELVKK